MALHDVYLYNIIYVDWLLTNTSCLHISLASYVGITNMRFFTHITDKHSLAQKIYCLQIDFTKVLAR